MAAQVMVEAAPGLRPVAGRMHGGISVLRLEQRCHCKSVISRRKVHPTFLGTVPVYACYFVTTEFPFIFKIVPVCKVNNLATLVIIKIP